MCLAQSRDKAPHRSRLRPHRHLPWAGLAGQGIYTYRQGDAEPWLLNNQLLFSADQQSQDFSKHPTPKMRLRMGLSRACALPAKLQSPTPVGGFTVRFCGEEVFPVVKAEPGELDPFPGSRKGESSGCRGSHTLRSCSPSAHPSLLRHKTLL